MFELWYSSWLKQGPGSIRCSFERRGSSGGFDSSRYEFGASLFSMFKNCWKFAGASSISDDTFSKSKFKVLATLVFLIVLIDGITSQFA